MNYTVKQSILPEIPLEIQPKKKAGLNLLWHRIQYYWYEIWDVIHVKLGEREFRAGKGKILHSLADLD